MYDATTAGSVTGGSLAMTGLSFGSGILLALGLVMVGVTLFMLVRRNGKHQP